MSTVKCAGIKFQICIYIFFQLPSNGFNDKFINWRLAARQWWKREEESATEIKALSPFVFRWCASTCRGASAPSSRSCEPIPLDKIYTSQGWAGMRDRLGRNHLRCMTESKNDDSPAQEYPACIVGPGERSSVSIMAASACPVCLSELGFQLQGN